MKVNVYSIFDQKARAFSQPFYCVNDEVADRAFSNTLRDETTMIGRYPGDYTCYRIGEFDDATGLLISELPPAFIAQGSGNGQAQLSLVAS